MLEEQEKRKKKKKQEESRPREDPSPRLSTFIAHQSGLDRGVIGRAELVDCVSSGDSPCGGELGPSPVGFLMANLVLATGTWQFRLREEICVDC